MENLYETKRKKGFILNKGHGKPVDWWTCGILLYEMIAGIDPFSDDEFLISIHLNFLK